MHELLDAHVPCPLQLIVELQAGVSDDDDDDDDSEDDDSEDEDEDSEEYSEEDVFDGGSSELEDPVSMVMLQNGPVRYSSQSVHSVPAQFLSHTHLPLESQFPCSWHLYR